MLHVDTQTCILTGHGHMCVHTHTHTHAHTDTHTHTYSKRLMILKHINIRQLQSRFLQYLWSSIGRTAMTDKEQRNQQGVTLTLLLRLDNTVKLLVAGQWMILATTQHCHSPKEELVFWVL